MKRRKNAILVVCVIAMVLVAVGESLRNQAQRESLTPPQSFRGSPRSAYTGPSQCVECHREKEAQLATSMARTLEATGDILHSHHDLTFRERGYTHRVYSSQGRGVYTVSDGVDSITVPVLWAVGHGEAGQTYVFQYSGALYESRVSFYRKIQNLSLTVGAALEAPAELNDALGRQLTPDEIQRCFGCHATAVYDSFRPRPQTLIAGVSCEACHGPGKGHVDNVLSGRYGRKDIFNPAALSTEEQANFCGSCHRTAAEVTAEAIRGVRNVRFQPYRLANSRCYSANDRRISCTACHDPHKRLERGFVAYDSKCLACHDSSSGSNTPGNRVIMSCPVGRNKCVTCHMPRYELPGAHSSFTDHQIRVVRPNSSYPN